MKLDIAQYTNRGGREINEDSLIVGDDYFAVADGLGGHLAGEIASAAAVDSLSRNCKGGYTAERINEIAEQANTDVLNFGGKGRTTLAAAFVENGIFRYVNAGDSRIYYFKNNRVYAHSRDHSVCQVSVEMGNITFEEIRGNEDRSRLLKVLGDSERLNLKKPYDPIEIEAGDAFLLCSDGFWENVIEGEMEADLIKSDSAAQWLGYMLKRQLKRAENKDDNYTAVCGIFADDTPVAAPVKKSRAGLITCLVIGAIAIGAAGIFLLKGKEETPPETPVIGSSMSDSDTLPVIGISSDNNTIRVGKSKPVNS